MQKHVTVFHLDNFIEAAQYGHHLSEHISAF